ncbi:MAG: sigma 54-interacting transcriptional regulator [Blastocatellia bacterium]|nr:sigma 54-interacting transcriptional regulator [Blastocatellia bacterium]
MVTIFDLLNGRFTERDSKIITNLWVRDNRYYLGQKLIETASEDEEDPPTPAEYFAAFLVATLRFDEWALTVLRDFEKYHGKTEPLWIAALQSHVGSWLKRPTPEADALLQNSGDPFFQALLIFKNAIQLKKDRDEGVPVTEAELLKPRLLFLQVIEVFERYAAFYAGRAYKEIADDVTDLEEQAEFLQLAQKYFKFSQMGHLKFRSKERKTQNETFRRMLAASVQDKTKVIGQFVRQLKAADSVEDLARYTVDFLSSSSVYGLDFCRFVSDEDDERKEIAGHGPSRAELLTKPVPLGFNYSLELPDTADIDSVYFLIPGLTERLSDLTEQQLQLADDRELILGHNKYKDPGYKAFVEMSRLAAKGDLEDNILLIGETGTGKGEAAKGINTLFGGKGFRIYNCVRAAQSLSNFEIELCGCPPGTYTDGKHERKGLFEILEGGTIFFDEIGDLPLEGQVWLLSVAGDRLYYRYGENKTNAAVEGRPLNVRIIAATNKPLEEYVTQTLLEKLTDKVSAAEQAKFREDLFFRFVYKIEVPPLRKVPKQIEHLAITFASEKQCKIEPAAMMLMKRYDWPGNIRQLKGILKIACQMAISAETKLITVGMVAKLLPSFKVPASLTKTEGNSHSSTVHSESAPLGEAPVIDVTQMPFLGLLREIITALPESRRQLFNKDDSILNIISKLLRQAGKPQPDSFERILLGLHKSQFAVTPEGAAKIRKLARLYSEITPNWKIPSQFSTNPQA